MEFTRTVYIGDVEFEAVFDAERSKPAILFGEDARPAEGGEAEISEARVGGVDILEFLNQSTIDHLLESVNDMVADCFAELDDTAMADAAEARRAE